MSAIHGGELGWPGWCPPKQYQTRGWGGGWGLKPDNFNVDISLVTEMWFSNAFGYLTYKGLAQYHSSIFALDGIVVSALSWHLLGRGIESFPGVWELPSTKTCYEVATVAMQG